VKKDATSNANDAILDANSANDAIPRANSSNDAIPDANSANDAIPDARDGTDGMDGMDGMDGVVATDVAVKVAKGPAMTNAAMTTMAHSTDWSCD
jgi:hypothetical protein